MLLYVSYVLFYVVKVLKCFVKVLVKWVDALEFPLKVICFVIFYFSSWFYESVSNQRLDFGNFLWLLRCFHFFCFIWLWGELLYLAVNCWIYHVIEIIGSMFGLLYVYISIWHYGFICDYDLVMDYNLCWDVSCDSLDILVFMFYRRF